MDHTRRGLFKIAALALAGMPRALAADGKVRAPDESLAVELARNRDKISTFRIQYQHYGGPRDRLNGANEVLFNRTAYHFRHVGPDDPWFTITTATEAVHAVGTPQQVRRWRYHAPASWPPAPSLENFLPVPLPIPSTEAGPPQFIGGEYCRGIAQSDRHIWIEVARPRVRRIEYFWPDRGRRVVEDYEGTTLLPGGVEFPNRIQFQLFDRRGVFRNAVTVLITDVEINTELEAQLFDTAPFRGRR